MDGTNETHILLKSHELSIRTSNPLVKSGLSFS